MRQLLERVGQQFQARRAGWLPSIECPPGEWLKFEHLAREHHLSVPALTCYPLLECCQDKRLTMGDNDEAVVQAPGMRHAHTLLRSLLYDEAWRLGLRPRG